jgi:hypothetical protein
LFHKGTSGLSFGQPRRRKNEIEKSLRGHRLNGLNELCGREHNIKGADTMAQLFRFHLNIEDDGEQPSLECGGLPPLLILH